MVLTLRNKNTQSRKLSTQLKLVLAGGVRRRPGRWWQRAQAGEDRKGNCPEGLSPEHAATSGRARRRRAHQRNSTGKRYTLTEWRTKRQLIH